MSMKTASAAHGARNIRAPRRDTVVATAVLIVLIAGWLTNFVEPKTVATGIGSVMTAAMTRQF